MSEQATYPGGCLCGGVRYVLKAAPDSIGDCHCADCRRFAGSPYVTWGSVRRANFQLLQGVIGRKHFAEHARCFAQCCGTGLYEEAGDDVDLTIASLDDPAPFAPTFAIWLEDRLPWVALQPGIPAYVRGSKSEIYQP